MHWNKELPHLLQPGKASVQQWRPSAATKDKQTKDSSMLWHLSVLHSFLWPNNDSLFGYTTLCLSADRHLGCFHFLAIMNLC